MRPRFKSGDASPHSKTVTFHFFRSFILALPVIQYSLSDIQYFFFASLRLCARAPALVARDLPTLFGQARGPAPTKGRSA
jgi:hypothetical protein